MCITVHEEKRGLALFISKCTSEEALLWSFSNWGLSTTGVSGEKMTDLFDAAAGKENVPYLPLSFLCTSTVRPSLSDELVKDEEELEKRYVLFGFCLRDATRNKTTKHSVYCYIYCHFF